MPVNERDGEDLIAGYIRRYTEPVQWVGWWLDATDPVAGKSLRSVLCEPGGEALRDLSESALRESVVRAVLGSEALRWVVGVEANRFLETIAERVARDQPQDAEPRAAADPGHGPRLS